MRNERTRACNLVSGIYQDYLQQSNFVGTRINLLPYDCFLDCQHHGQSMFVFKVQKHLRWIRYQLRALQSDFTDINFPQHRSIQPSTLVFCI